MAEQQHTPEARAEPAQRRDSALPVADEGAAQLPCAAASPGSSDAPAPNEVAQAGTADWESGQFVWNAGSIEADDAATSRGAETSELERTAHEFAELASRASVSELDQLTQQVAHLQGLNGAATDKFNEMAEYGRGMSVFLEALEDKQQGVEPLMVEIDALDSQMTALETMLERLDAATSRLNDKIAAANTAP